VVGYEESYVVSGDGQVFSIRANRLLTLDKHAKGGHLRARLCKRGKVKNAWVHCIMLEAFVGPRPFAGAEGRHLDGKPARNVLDNLCWGTRQENQQDKAKHGSTKGVRHWHAKIDEARVHLVRQLHKYGCMSYSEIARALKMVKATVADIVSRRSWTHV
jgi:hypothetical protein